MKVPRLALSGVNGADFGKGHKYLRWFLGVRFGNHITILRFCCKSEGR